MTPYTSPLRFTRTDAERRDPFRSWRRSDQAFFASGACHILANLFVQLHHHEGFVAEYLRPRGGDPGSHMYATDGTWAFDFDGWTPKHEMLTVIAHEYRSIYPAWDFDLIAVEGPVESHCAQLGLRSPQNFPHLPWGRAYAYIETFAPGPPSTRDDAIGLGTPVVITNPDSGFAGQHGAIAAIYTDSPAARASGCPILDVALVGGPTINLPATSVEPRWDERSITCPKCGRTSYNLNDIANGYCGSCHDWTSKPAEAIEPIEQEGESNG